MQYLREEVVNQACMLHVKASSQNSEQPPSFGGYTEMIAYENAQGKIAIGSIEHTTKLQTRRVGFRK